MLFRYSKKEKDYLVSSLGLGVLDLPKTMGEAKELTKESVIEHITYTFKEQLGKIIGGIVYSILVGTLIFVIQNLLI